MQKFIGLFCVFAMTITTSLGAEKFPKPDQLPSSKALPDPLIFFNGEPVKSKGDWYNKRRPELRELFQHYMYGYFPRPAKIKFKVERTDKNLFGGKATQKQVGIWFGPPGNPEAVKINLLLVTPNQRKKPAPVFLGLNFCGNHMLLNDPTIPLPEVWMPNSCPGCTNNQATEKGRGAQVDVWALDQAVERGYAMANFYVGDIDPDKHDWSDGAHPHFFKKGQTKPGETDWGTIAAWAYGPHRAVDYLVRDKDIDADRIAVVGHSRNGKTALLAAAFDDRIALAIPSQAGCGGTAPSRGTVGESVKQINDRFPHWFNDVFTNFNERTDRIPFDQHSLVALMAPRPVLFPNAVEDSWANPAGQFEVLQAADKVYQFLGVSGLEASAMPEPGRLINSRLGYYIRPGKHSMTREDWKVFLDFADKWLTGDLKVPKSKK